MMWSSGDALPLPSSCGTECIVSGLLSLKGQLANPLKEIRGVLINFRLHCQEFRFHHRYIR